MFRRTYKILIIDDEKHNHPLFEKAFTDAGFSVTIRADADDTPETTFTDEVALLAPHVISMDLMLAKADGQIAERDGIAAIKALRGDTRTQNIPIVVVTNFHQDKNIQQAKEAGATDFISLQGQSLSNIANQLMQVAKKPRRYNPSHPAFKE